ncbi:MAG: endonuclease/exonuclease/phosphatase family protein [Actinomycetota bacterium]|nr:endonuclease/exonuclease/phosphatase family protein [Actinomycetota bacterium]
MVAGRSHRMKSITRIFLLLGAASFLILSPGPAHADPTIPSPAGEVLVVTANLREAYADADVADSSDMQVFADRLLAQTPYLPDVLLLQEVNRNSAATVASILGAAAGSPYVVAVDPGLKQNRRTESHVVKVDTAVLINPAGVTSLDPGGFVSSYYDSVAAAAGKKPIIKKHAHTLVEEVAGPLRLSLASVHLVPRGFLASDEVDRKLRKRWSRRVADALSTNYPSTSTDDISVIGGDFNAGHCLLRGGSRNRCEKYTPFWNLLVNGYGYIDTMRATTNPVGVDYVFASEGVSQAGMDRDYQLQLQAGTVDPAEYYSDHAFRWAVVTGPDVTPPTSVELTGEPGWNPKAILTWTKAIDSGGSGLDHYEVWRSSTGTDFQLVSNVDTGKTRYEDIDVKPDKRYWYYVAALDGAGNESRSSVVEVRISD